MICKQCGYMMDAFDKECPRCHADGTAPGTPTPSPAAASPAPTPSATPASVATAPTPQATNKFLMGCAIVGCVLGILPMGCAVVMVIGGSLIEDPPYEVMDRREGTQTMSYDIRVPGGTTQSEADQWFQELANRRRDKGATVFMYDGPLTGTGRTMVYECSVDAGEAGDGCIDVAPDR